MKVISLLQDDSTAVSTKSLDVRHDGKITFLNREDGSVNFQRKWQDYKIGFGDLDGEFWLGLDAIHNITNSKSYGLVVDFSDFDGRFYQSRYSMFRVGPESDNYRLKVNGYDSSSTGGDSLTDGIHSINNMMFTTHYIDNDPWHYNCAVVHYGGWWYRECGSSNPTGRYLSGGQDNYLGIMWFSGKNNEYSYLTMKLTLVIVKK